jgi:hypothetical protein|tara:strand:+ start:656 stop:913 length:258 start_codon:yes stop_codon:yes gene_type:complete
MTKTSHSEVFENWSNEVKKILNQLPTNTIDGQPLEYQDDDFQTCMTKLQQCALKFEEFPIYPINEKIAAELVWDQLRGYDERPNI